ncbi:MAG: acetyl-CoA carboxylase carboxyltransferase subunit alpha [Kiritimatiellia bacterium]
MSFEFEKPLEEIETRISELTALKETKPQVQAEIDKLTARLNDERKAIYSRLSAWETVQVARHPERPSLRDYIAHLFKDFVELHGDRAFGDDQAIIGGFATLFKHRVLIIGHQKGKSVEENIKFNFGMARPEGYRKALRLMKMAEKFSLPVISFIDTSGAFPGLDAEERGQAEAIARNLRDMSRLAIPILVVVTGEGGSGGALGIGVGDRILMLSNSVYSVISPEGCASILWRDGSKAPEAAEALKITAPALLKLKIIDEIIPEPAGGAHRNMMETMKAVRKSLLKHLAVLKGTGIKKLLERRYEKLANIGRF